ncbi:MAG: radical SAM protein [Nitrospirota bacterium]
MKLREKFKHFFVSGQKAALPEFPGSVILEPTNACNLRCRMCPAYGEGVKRKRDAGFIKKEIWKSVIDEIGSWPESINLDIHGAGEPLLHPEFFEIVSYAKKKKNLTVGFLCNATLLDQEKAKSVIELGVDWICFSVDAAEKEVFEYYRKGAALDTVEENIRFLSSVRREAKPYISLNMVHHEEADLEAFIDKWSGVVDSLTISAKRPVDREDNVRLKLLKPCPMLYSQIVIGWPGKTGLCCEDFWGDYITGELPSQSLYDIWHGKAFKKARSLHEAGRQERLNLCRTCDTIIFHQYEEKTIEKNGKKTIVRKELADLNHDLAMPYDRE